MLQIVLDISKVALGTAFATFIAITIIKPKTTAGTVFSMLFGIAVTLASMKFYSEYGQTPEDKLACVIFSSGSACSKGGARRIATEKPPPFSRPAIPTATDIPRKAQRTAPRAEADLGIEVGLLTAIPTDGWWPVRTPVPTDAISGSPNDLWQWAMRNKGSCEPLRKFVDIYPQDAHASEARRILEGRKTKIKPQVRIYNDGKGPLTYPYEVYDRNKSEAQACSDLKKSIVDGQPISFEGGVKKGWADCSARIDGANAAGARKRLLGYRDIQRINCTCTSTFLDGLILGLRTCSMEYERICKVEEIGEIMHERCDK